MSVRRLVLLVVLMALFWSHPALAQVDLTGLWRPFSRDEDGSGMDGDYAGLPLNAAGRWRAQSWAPENFEVPEWVCRPHAWDFSLEAGAARLRWLAEIDDPTQRLIAFHGRLTMREQGRARRLEPAPDRDDIAHPASPSQAPSACAVRSAVSSKKPSSVA